MRWMWHESVDYNCQEDRQKTPNHHFLQSVNAGLHPALRNEQSHKPGAKPTDEVVGIEDDGHGKEKAEGAVRADDAAAQQGALAA